MELKKISLFNKKKIYFNLQSEQFKSEILNDIETNFDLKYNTRFYNIPKNDKFKQLIEKKNNIMSIKLSGNYYLLYCTTINNIQSCFLISTKLVEGFNTPRIIFVRYRFKSMVYENTIFLVELTSDQSKLVINDCLIFKNLKISDKPFRYRQNIINSIFKDSYIPDQCLETYSLELKKYYPCNSDGEIMIKHDLLNINYKAKGILFSSTSIFRPFILVYLNSKNTSISLKKEKEPFDINLKCISNKKSDDIYDDNKNNIKNNIKYNIFKIEKTHTPGIYQLLCIKQNKLYKYDIARVDNIECQNFLTDLFINKNNNIYVKCKYNTHFKKFVPIERSNVKSPDHFNIIKKNLII